MPQNGSAPEADEAERAVLGSLLVSNRTIRDVVVRRGLGPQHFAGERHQAIYRAIIRLAVDRAPVDAITVWAQLERDTTPPGITRSYVNALADETPAPGNAPHYAGLVIEAANYRWKRRGAQRILEGVEKRDDALIQAGLEEAATPLEDSEDPTEAADIGDAIWRYLNEKGTPERFELPWPGLNDGLTAGGFTRREFNLIVGWTSLGKSLLLDHLLEHWSKRGYRAFLFGTEMNYLARGLRFVSIQSGVPVARLRRRLPLEDEERERVKEACQSMPFGFEDASGWTAARVCQSIVARELDVAAVDPLNLIPFRDTREYDEILRQLKETANRANCLILAVSQLNMRRASDQNPPAPELRDIRDSGNAQYIATNIMSVHRFYKGGDPTTDAELRFLKVRDGVRTKIKATFVESSLRFVEKPRTAPKKDALVLDYRQSDDPD